MEYSKAFLGQSTLIPIPLLPKKFISRFTLISRMVLGVGKKSEIRLKFEDSVPEFGSFAQKAGLGSYESSLLIAPQ